MILQVCCVLQVISIQVISAQLLNRDLSSQNVLNHFVYTPLADRGYGRSRRQIVNPLVGEPGSGVVPLNGFANGLPSRNSMPFGNLPRGGGLPNNFALSNGLPNNLAFNNGLPNSFAINNGLPNTPFNLPFPSVNIASKNRMIPNVNGLNSNGLPLNIPNGLPSFNHVPHGLPSLNNMPNTLPSFNNVPNGLPNLNNVLNGLPSFNNVPNGFTGFNNVPNALPGLNNMPNGLPSFNNVPNALPSLNNLPNGLPSFNNMPNGLPSLNNVPNRLPSFNHLPFPNMFLNLNNVPVGQNILNSNNVPAANSLLNLNNMPILNGLPSLNNLPCGNASPPLPLSNGLPLNNLPSGNLMPSINSQLPYLNDFRITEIGIGNGVLDVNRFPRNDLVDGNIMSSKTNNFQNGHRMAQQVPDKLSNINNYQNNNGLSPITNTPANDLSNVVTVDNRFSNINDFPIGNGASNIASLAKNIKNMQLNNKLQDISNFQNYNEPFNKQKFVSNIPFNNGFANGNKQVNTDIPNANSRLMNAINNGMPLSNGGYLNDILFANNGMVVNMPETYIKNSDGNGIPSNDFQSGNTQVPGNNWHYDFIGQKMPANNNLLPEGFHSNVESGHQSVLMSNHLDLAQELIKNLKIEGNMPFLNGLPVAGITETVTVLNGPCSK